MGAISIINPSPGSEFSEPTEVFLDTEKNAYLYNPTEMIDETSTGSKTYYAEITIGTPTAYGFQITGDSEGGLVAYTFWSTDSLTTSVATDTGWTDVTRITTGLASVSGAEVDAVYPVVTHLQSKKLKVKCVVTGGTTHNVVANALTLI